MFILLYRIATIFQKTVLDNGVRVLTEFMPQVRSLSLGFWFNVGSRDEPEDLTGIAHYLEHMNFKGTARRSPVVIAREIEGRGGHLNAFTSKENTCFFARFADRHLTRAVDVLADITLHSSYDKEEAIRERSVIYEEIASVEDTPDDLVFEQYYDSLFKYHQLSKPVLGTRETLARISPEILHQFKSDHYTGNRIVISAAGNVNHKKLVKLIDHRITIETENKLQRNYPQSLESKEYRVDNFTATQQAHIVWGCRSLRFEDARKYQLLILVTLLGGGMSSRLFQRIRERQGLAYNIFAVNEAYTDTGMFAVYAATDPQNCDKTIRNIKREIRELVRKPISDRELKVTKDQLMGSLMLSLESPNSRMNRLARYELNNLEWQPIDAVISGIYAVSSKDVQNIAIELFERRATYINTLLPNNGGKNEQRHKTY